MASILKHCGIDKGLTYFDEIWYGDTSWPLDPIGQ